MSEEYIVNNFENLLLNCPPKVLNVELKKMRIKLRKKIWYHKNKEKEKEKGRKYRKDNPEKRKEICRKYKKNNPEKERESCRKGKWKSRGLNMENIEEIYEKYMNTTHCNMCEVLLTVGGKSTKTTKCMDHSHLSGEFRRVICHSCNVKLPKHT